MLIFLIHKINYILKYKISIVYRLTNICQIKVKDKQINVQKYNIHNIFITIHIHTSY